MTASNEPARSPREIVWGHSRRSSRVHLFIDGTRQCISSRGQQQKAHEVFPAWDINDPDTCRKCRERYYWLQKGAIPAPTTLTPLTAPTA